MDNVEALSEELPKITVMPIPERLDHGPTRNDEAQISTKKTTDNVIDEVKPVTNESLMDKLMDFESYIDAIKHNGDLNALVDDIEHCCVMNDKAMVCKRRVRFTKSQTEFLNRTYLQNPDWDTKFRS